MDFSWLRLKRKPFCCSPQRSVLKIGVRKRKLVVSVIGDSVISGRYVENRYSFNSILFIRMRLVEKSKTNS